ncbi:MAG: hypothetical protein GY898_11245 [Proteobacteria bacterium]|nr:hypothetical protein [Pseudomonadota bacterium]
MRWILLLSVLLLAPACTPDDECLPSTDGPLPAYVGGALVPPVEGAYVTTLLDPIEPCGELNVDAIAEFERDVGVSSFVAWCVDDWEDPNEFGGDANPGIQFPVECVKSAARVGKIPYIRWNPRTTITDWPQRVIASGFAIDEDVDPADVPPEALDDEFGLQRVIDGEFDADFERWALEAEAFRGALIVEICSEFSGFQYTCNGVYNGGSVTDGFGDPDIPDGPERFQEAWRHIVDIFEEAGADNVTWVLHYDSTDPTDLPQELAEWNSMANYYPGDDYVDWIGVSAYGQEDIDDPWTEFADLMDANLDDLTALSDDVPVGVVEFGTHKNGEGPDGETVGEWITGMFDALQTEPYDAIRWLGWYQTIEYDITAADGGTNAFRAGAGDAFFVTEPVFE